MIVCKVIGHVWATKKEEGLTGFKLMVVQETETAKDNGTVFVAADVVCAGIGDQVLVVTGSTARKAVGSDACPIDATIVGIIDSLEIDREKASMEE